MNGVLECFDLRFNVFRGYIVTYLFSVYSVFSIGFGVGAGSRVDIKFVVRDFRSVLSIRKIRVRGFVRYIISWYEIECVSCDA